MGRGGRGWIAAAALAALLIAAAPARAGFSIEYPQGPDPAIGEWPSWPHPVSCGRTPFDPASAFDGPTGAENGSGAPELALRRFLDERVDPSAPIKYWRVVSAAPTEVEFAQGRLAQGPFRIAFALSEGQWRPDGLPSYCVPRTVREDAGAVAWTLSKDQTLTPSTRTIQVRVGGFCGHGLETAEFHRAGRRLAMTLWSPTPTEHCLTRLKEPLAVKLPGALGRRKLFDGSVYPPRLRQ